MGDGDEGGTLLTVGRSRWLQEMGRGLWELPQGCLRKGKGERKETGGGKKQKKRKRNKGIHRFFLRHLIRWLEVECRKLRARRLCLRVPEGWGLAGGWKGTGRKQKSISAGENLSRVRRSRLEARSERGCAVLQIIDQRQRVGPAGIHLILLPALG